MKYNKKIDIMTNSILAIYKVIILKKLIILI